MADTITRAEDVLDLLVQVDTNAIKWEQKKLRAIHGWAMRQIGVDYSVGDRVEIVRQVADQARTPGWWHYREALAPGATATVQSIDFSPNSDGSDGTWRASILLDREWSVHDATGMLDEGKVRHYWDGPDDETPDGMEPPGRYDQEHYPQGRKHTFFVHAEDLRAVRDRSAGIE